MGTEEWPSSRLALALYLSVMTTQEETLPSLLKAVAHHLRTWLLRDIMAELKTMEDHMASDRTALDAQLVLLNQAIADLRQRVTDRVTSMQAQIDALIAKNDETTSIDLSAEIAQLQADLADLQGIATTPA